MLNIVAVMGRLVRDPELKQTTSGKSVCNFTIACDRNFSSNGEKQADFLQVVAWNQTAEFICKYFQKGSMIAVNGSLQQRQYQDKQGNKRTVVEILAQNASFCGGKETNHAAPKNDSKPISDGVGSNDFDPVDDSADLPF